MDIQVFGSSSSGNCYYVSDGDTSLLLECGLPIKDIKRRLNFQLSGIAGVMLTHEHADHAKAVKDIMKAGIDCYMSNGTKEALNVSGHRVKVVNPKEPFHIGTWTILPFETQHDAAEPLGYLLANKRGEKLLYATDTYYVRYRFNGLSHLMLECNYSLDILQANVDRGIVPLVLKNRLLKSHFSLDNVKGFLSANDLSKVKEIWLIHLSNDNSDAERFKREIAELTGVPVHVAGE